MKRPTARLAAATLLSLGLVVSASPVAAAPVTPNGLCGARNMVNEHSREAMLDAMMNHTDEHGDAGMFRAVALTACS
jgi:Spy/CpxP family protein refolding chaperone